MTKGLPASGKSTWANDYVMRNPGWKRINRDDLRSMIDAGKWSPENEFHILEARDTLLKQFLGAGLNVIIDDTNLRASNFNDVASVIRSTGWTVDLSEKAFPIDVDEAIKRDSMRPASKSVGKDVILGMWNRFKSNKDLMQERTKSFEARTRAVLKQDESLSKAIICDLDGTLALIGARNPYDASRCDELDTPNKPVVESVRQFYSAGYRLLFVSGRKCRDADPTMRFLNKHLPEVNDMTLIMRADDDNRMDTIVKREMWDNHIAGKYNVLLAIDDRPSVVRMWRYEIGLPVLAVNDIEF